jgi:hypothetical protein
MVWLDGSLFMKPLWDGAERSASDFEASNSVLPDVRPPVPRLTQPSVVKQILILAFRCGWETKETSPVLEPLLDCLLKFLARRLRR